MAGLTSASVPAPPSFAATLALEAHPEGGWYRRTWTSPVAVTVTDADEATRTRPTATLILFALGVGEQSAWHRVSSDEIWIANDADGLRLQLGGDGDAPIEGEVRELGDPAAGRHPQVLVPAGVWQRTLPAVREALVSCVVSPGFDFADFVLADG